jgi:hypothetical protein
MRNIRLPHSPTWHLLLLLPLNSMAAPIVLDLESAKFPGYAHMTDKERAVLEDDGKIHPTRWFRRENWGQ